MPLLRDGLLEAETLVDVRGIVPRGIDGTRIGAGTTLAELEADAGIPDALREACRLAASPQLRNMGSVAGNLLQSTRCWYWRLNFPCRLHGGDTCHALAGEHREHAIFGNGYCASAHPSDVAAALIALGATMRTTNARARSRRPLPPSDRRRPQPDHARAGRADPRARCPATGEEHVPEGDGAPRWSFPIVGVAAARSSGERRIVLAGVAPVPWVLDSPDALADATPLPGTAYKVEIAEALVRRALEAVA